MKPTKNRSQPLASASVPYKVTAAEVVRFNRALLNRAKGNLINAQQRGDSKAAANIERKIAIYEYTISMAEYYGDEGLYINKHITEAGD